MNISHDDLMRLADEYANGWFSKGTKQQPRRAALSTALTEVLAERDATAKDAARYRWLRDHHRSDVSHRLTWYLPRMNPLSSAGLDDHLDQCIDQAMKGQTP